MSSDATETSAASRLPEADSLPDGFVESSADEPPPEAAPQPPDTDYKEAFLDTVDRSPHPDGRLDDAEGTIPTDSFAERSNLGQCGDTVEVKDTVLLPISGSGTAKEPEVSKSPKDNQDTEACLELNISTRKERCTTEHTEHLKNQKMRSSWADYLWELGNEEESTEAKRKVVKRSIKSDKELLEFTLQYQKVIAERDAAVAVRERLESLCRELQRQNKMLMDECQRVSTEGQNMRSELSTKFNDAIKDVTVKLEEQKNDCLSQLGENEMLRNKLQHLANQYDLSEQQFAQKLKQKMLELQLADLKIQQQQERSAQEQTQMRLYAEQVTQLLSTEKDLRLQLAADGEKFQQFQEALLKSNEVFETFKQEMEKMAKLTKDLKKENEFLKGKCERSDIAIVNLIEEREHMKKQLEKVKNQKEKLESLCRSLQAERKYNPVASEPINSVPVQANVDCKEESS